MVVDHSRLEDSTVKEEREGSAEQGGYIPAKLHIVALNEETPEIPEHNLVSVSRKDLGVSIKHNKPPASYGKPSSSSSSV